MVVRLLSKTSETYGGIDTRNSEAVFERDGKSMQRAQVFTRLPLLVQQPGSLYSLLEEYFSEAIDLILSVACRSQALNTNKLLGDCSTFAKRNCCLCGREGTLLQLFGQSISVIVGSDLKLPGSQNATFCRYFQHVEL